MTESLSEVATGKRARRERRSEIRAQYFDALKYLRYHIHSCLQQVAKIAGMETPKVAVYLRPAGDWEGALYAGPQSPQRLTRE